MELADWKLKDAIRSAREDNEWEREMDESSFKSGEIRITMDATKGLQARGAGIVLGKAKETEPLAVDTPKKTLVKPIPKDAIPAIASKTVKAKDVVEAAPQAGNFGLELSTLSKE